MEREKQVRKLSLILSLLFLFGCAAVPDKPDMASTTAIQVNGSQCGPTSTLKRGIDKLGERLVASALMRITSNDTVIVAFFSGRDGDWTVIIDGRNGISCMVMWGKHWRMVGGST